MRRGVPHSQITELSLGVSLQVLRFLLGEQCTALSVHLPHEALTLAADCLVHFGRRPQFARRWLDSPSAQPLWGAR
jgi:hypothetical protein